MAGGRAGTYAKTAARREEILDAAIDTFAAMGYLNGSLRAVAQRAGMAETTVLHHFSSKQMLLTELLERREQRTRISVSGASDVIAALTSVLADDRDDATLTELYVRLAAEAIEPSHPAHGYFVQRYAHARMEMTAAFEDIARHGRLPSGVTPASAATLLLAVWDGLQTQWLLDRGAVDVRAEVRIFLLRLLSPQHTNDVHTGKG